jgi:RNA polymerase sigma-70 factor (ECF subfamily)
MEVAAFKACFDATRAPLMGYLSRVSGNLALAEDLLQEAYLRLLDRPPRDQRPEALRSWLFTTATRLLKDHWRRERTWSWWPWENDNEEASLVPEPRSQEPLPDQIAEGQQQVARGFAALSPRQRSLLWLLHVEGLDHAATARALGLGTASIRVLAHRARERMWASLVTTNDQNEGSRHG